MVCKAQFCSYRDHPDEFVALGATVVGISAQDVASHQGFIEKNTAGAQHAWSVEPASAHGTVIL